MASRRDSAADCFFEELPGANAQLEAPHWNGARNLAEDVEIVQAANCDLPAQAKEY